eukprot:Gb_38401 [translate_table: standard]
MPLNPESPQMMDLMSHGLKIQNEDVNWHNTAILNRKTNSNSVCRAQSPLSSPLFHYSSTPLYYLGRSKAAIPFIWEDKPGIPKQQQESSDAKTSSQNKVVPDDDLNLRPPPLLLSYGQYCYSGRRLFKKKSMEMEKCEDPFQTALMECTKIRNGGGSSSNNNRAVGSKKVFTRAYSCMRACSIIEGQVMVPTRRFPSQQAI